jgi:hypothetical protein
MSDDEQYKCEEPEIVKIEAMGRINVVTRVLNHWSSKNPFSKIQ